MDRRDRILILGHRGLVGSNLVRRLLNDYYTDLKFDNGYDLRESEDVHDIFRLTKPDIVFNCAAKVGGINFNKTYPADFFYDNIMIGSNVVEACRKFEVNKLINLGSACIYPKVCPQPIKEEYLMTAPLEETNEAYAMAKIAILKMCQAYNKQHGLNAINLMPANLFGPNDKFHPEHSHVIPGMINKLYTAKMKNIPSVTFWGDGTPIREFLYVEDLVDAMIFLAKNYDDPAPINVGTGEAFTIKEIFSKINYYIGYSGDIIWDSKMPNGTPRRELDNSKLASLGWSPMWSFEDALFETIQWYKENIYGV